MLLLPLALSPLLHLSPPFTSLPLHLPLSSPLHPPLPRPHTFISCLLPFALSLPVLQSVSLTLSHLSRRLYHPSVVLTFSLLGLVFHFTSPNIQLTFHFLSTATPPTRQSHSAAVATDSWPPPFLPAVSRVPPGMTQSPGRGLPQASGIPGGAGRPYCLGSGRTCEVNCS